MNNETNANRNATSNERPRNEADKFLELLWARDIVSPIISRAECKMQIVKLGLTVPDPSTDRLLFATTQDQEVAYLFACTRDSKSDTPRLCFTGYRFDIAMYRKSPVPDIDVQKALRFFAFAVAQLEGLDLATYRVERQRPGRN